MKKWVCMLYAGSLLFTSCSDKKNATPAVGDAGITAVNGDSSDTFFPVTAFLKGQILELDSLPVTVLQVTAADGRLDSSWISKEKTITFLQPFTADLIDEKNLTPYFKESRFNDQTTEAITFTYNPQTTLHDGMAIRHWDVYADPEKGTIKRIYIVRQLKESGVSFTQQLTWQTGKSAKIIMINNATGKVVSDRKWIWDFKE